MKKKKVYFVSGIDTDAGKSFATGFVAREWNKEGIRTITQKFVQTGNTDVSEDILVHRQIMGIGMTPEDDSKLTMPEIFSFPCSPHLAARIDGRPIDFSKIEHAIEVLTERYDTVLVEGAGGLMVPLTDGLLTIDYVAKKNFPMIFVTSGKLGSISTTLLSLEAIKARGIQLDYVVYNQVPDGNPIIMKDTQSFIEDYLKQNFPATEIILLPRIDL